MIIATINHQHAAAFSISLAANTGESGEQKTGTVGATKSTPSGVSAAATLSDSREVATLAKAAAVFAGISTRTVNAMALSSLSSNYTSTSSSK
jgi:uncharacterized protein YdbL (DUF1318 family)